MQYSVMYIINLIIRGKHFSKETQYQQNEWGVNYMLLYIYISFLAEIQKDNSCQKDLEGNQQKLAHNQSISFDHQLNRVLKYFLKDSPST